MLSISFGISIRVRSKFLTWGGGCYLLTENLRGEGNTFLEESEGV